MTLLIPVLGAPLVGKSTVLTQLAHALGTTTSSREMLVPSELVPSMTALVASCACDTDGRSREAWCIRAGAKPEWPLEMARRSRFGVLVLDPQRAYAERQQLFIDVALRELSLEWAVIVTKGDLTELGIASWDPVSADLRAAPILRYSAERADAPQRVREFFVEDVFPRVDELTGESPGLEELLGPPWLPPAR